MQHIPFNSRYEYHKLPFGAVGAGSEILLRIVMPRYMRITEMSVILRNEFSGEYAYREFEWECMEGDGEEWWKAVICPEETAVYTYYFEYQSNDSKGYIKSDGKGKGYLTEQGKPWQLTVYDEKANSPDWIKGGIIYQIFPDRFYKSEEKKNNIPNDRILRNDWGGQPNWKPDSQGRIFEYDYFGGDLQGIEQKLDYLKMLNITCIYLNPIFEAHSNHRYDTADYMKIDPLLGDENDLCSLCEAAHKKGMKIILDGVFSHTGDDSIYFNAKMRYPLIGAANTKDSPYYDWYSFTQWPDKYKCWWGIDILPEINETSPDFMEYITGENGVLRHWMKCGADGWRLDVADELPDIFLESLYKTVCDENSRGYIVGEVWEDASNKVSYGNLRKYLLGSQMHSVMNYIFSNTVMEFVKRGITDNFMNSIMTVCENYPAFAVNSLMNHIGTHDTVRAITALVSGEVNQLSHRKRRCRELSPAEYKEGIVLMKIAAAIQYTLPGLPSVYYGDEAGAEGGLDPFNRGCFPWGYENGELLKWYVKLGEIRNKYKVFREGRFYPVSSTLRCIAYERRAENESVMLIANRNGHGINYILPYNWYGAEQILGDGEILWSSINIPENSAVILYKTNP